MKLLHGIAALALVLLFSTLALADTFPGDPHMIPAGCTLGTVGCGSIPVPGNVFPVVFTGTTGSFSLFFTNPINSGNPWGTLTIVIGAAFTDLTPSDYNFLGLLSTTPVGNCPFDATCFQAFGDPPLVSVVGGQTTLTYPALIGSVEPGQDLALFGALFPMGQNIPIAIAANGATPMSLVPEPGTLALLLTGMVGVVARRRLSKHRIDHS